MTSISPGDSHTKPADYDAILIVSFGGPENTDEVIPFLENVTRGRRIPRERLEAVAEHYYHFGGKSPLNDQVRLFITALRTELDQHGTSLPIYWGNRNWHPFLADTTRAMAASGVQRALAFVLSAFSSYSSCRQYRENIAAACSESHCTDMTVDKIRVFYNHPGFINAAVDRVKEQLAHIPADRRESTMVAYTAHSIPMSMAENCDYAKQLNESCRLVSEQLGIPAERWHLTYQSRSGRPSDPWLEPDINDHLRELKTAGKTDAIIMPIGFLTDHLEVLYDLDEEARVTCEEIGLNMLRAGTVGNHPSFIAMARELIQERLTSTENRLAIGHFEASHDVCPEDCCLYPALAHRPGRDDE